MTVKIKDKEFDLCYSMRMMVIYENITGENLDFTNMTSIKTITTMFLACILASAKKAKLDFDISYDEYIDWLDDNGGYHLINEFAVWIANELNAKYSLLKDEEEKGSKKPKKAKN